MSKNILYIGFFSLPDHDAAANRVLNNAKALRMCGNNVIFLDEQQEYEYKDFLSSKHLIQGFETWSVVRPHGASQYLKKMTDIQYVNILLKIYKNIDLVIAYNYPAIALERLRRLCRREKILITADCTEWYSGKEYNFPFNILSAMDSFYRMRVVHKRLDGVISISSFLNDYYADYNSVFIPPLVDLSEAKWSSPTEEYEGSLNLVYAGNPGRSKENLLPIVEAINSLDGQDVFLKVVGITKKQFTDLYPGSESKLSSNMQFLGRVSHIENLKIVKSSDFLIFLREKTRANQAGFSTKFVEAITLGTAVITTDTGDLKEYIEKYKCGVIVADKDSLIQVLNWNSKQLKQYSTVSDAARTVFSYRNFVIKFENWLKNVSERG